ncbi:hypothetical protein PsorP6_002439 [Peronosclerospora sorghi]|uniref:Uncharacterized protein n=1 Tax=Peronosclerospora sorghi TaxID=230839 RepID=A0ACC0WW19_9STRA|nr:hypothetical protein PsorP6_002439 [Peronosclerospora sorghi]
MAAPLRAPTVSKKPNPSVSKPAVCEERNGSWQIEYQTGPEPLTVSDISMKQQVYIFGCEGAAILPEGKAKHIVLVSVTSLHLLLQAYEVYLFRASTRMT